MGDADYVMRTNALGTLNVNEVFFETAGEGAAIVNVASMAAHVMPDEVIPAGYLTGTDILNDGGVVASIRERSRVSAQN